MQLTKPNHNNHNNCVELNIFMFWDGCKLNLFFIYHFDEKYHCLLISYKLTLFQQKQGQQQPVIDLENGVIVKIYNYLMLFLFLLE